MALSPSQSKPRLVAMLLTFCNEAGKFIGGCIVQAPDIVSAVMKAHRLGINPGGEVEGSELTAALLPSIEYRDRLLNKQELIELGLIVPNERQSNELQSN